VRWQATPASLRPLVGEASDNRRRMACRTVGEPAAATAPCTYPTVRRPRGQHTALGAERSTSGLELQNLSRERGGTLTLLVVVRTKRAGVAASRAQGYHVVISPVLNDEVRCTRYDPVDLTGVTRRAAGCSPGTCRARDKSISHRSVLIGALSDARLTWRGFGRSADTQSRDASARSAPDDDSRRRPRRPRWARGLQNRCPMDPHGAR